MAKKQTRLDLTIDIFTKLAQPAQVLPELTPAALITAILQEFQELEYLGDSAEQYALQRHGDTTMLDADLPLQQQVNANERLVLLERGVALPAGTQRTAPALYLREQGNGKVYKLPWTPAIIGRPDRDQPHNEWVAVNLATHPGGVRVSRRHAQITEVDGQFYLTSLSNNPTYLRRDVMTTEVTTVPQPLQHGDIIILERSYIALKLIVRAEGSNGQP